MDTPQNTTEDLQRILDGYLPDYRRKALQAVEQLLPKLKAEYESDEAAEMKTTGNESSLDRLIGRIVEHLEYERPTEQQRIINTLTAELPEAERAYREEQARDVLVGEILAVVSNIPLVELVLLAGTVRGNRV